MRLIIILFILFFTLYANETPWSGKWDMYWKDGSVTMEFTQTGDTVTGHYYPYGGNFTGKVENNTLTGLLRQKKAENRLTLTLSPDQNSFFGTLWDTEWINGSRIIGSQRSEVAPYDLTTPYNTFASFLRLANSVRNGKHENLTHAIACLDMGEKNAKLRPHERFLLAGVFFDVIDEYTVFLRTLMQKEVDESGHYRYTMSQQGTTETFDLEFVQGKDEKWRIKMPPKGDLQKKLATLLKARGESEVNPKRYLKLESPRDTMRTFIEQINRWDKGGKEHVVNTLNLLHTDPKIREWEAPILAQYLKQVIDRTQVIIYQEIPNDPKSELDYVYFNHPLGKIVIAPFEVDGKIRWQFTPETLSTISALNEAMDNLPIKEGILKLGDTTYFFALRHEAKKISPWLINKLFYLEIWQWLSIGLILFFALTISQFFSTLTKRVLDYIPFTKDLNHEGMVLRYLRPMRLLTIGVIWSVGLIYIGIPEFLFVTLRLIGLLLITIGLTWLAYNLINLVMTALHHRTKQTDTDIDDILVSLIGSTMKIIVIIAGFFALRHEAKKISPWLINKLFYLEIWQWFSIGLILFFALSISQFFSTLTKRVLDFIPFTKDLNHEGMVLRYLRPMRLLTIGIIWSVGLIYIGIPEFLFVTLRLIGLLLITIGLTWLAYNLINLVMAALHHRTKQTDTDIDDILVSLIGSTICYYCRLFCRGRDLLCSVSNSCSWSWYWWFGLCHRRQRYHCQLFWFSYYPC